jgi:hypothetical protein
MNVKKPRQPVRSGALTIVITCVLILLAVLSLLSLVSAQTDKALSDRQMAFAQQDAMSERVGQEWLASMDDYLRGGAYLPENTQVDGNTYSTTIRFSMNQYLHICAEADSEAMLHVTKWDIETVAETESTEALPAGAQPLTEDENGYVNTLPDSTVEGTGLA